MAQNYTEQLRKDNVRDAIYEDLQNNCEVLRTSWSGNSFPANPKVGQPCYRVDEDKLYYWDGHKWSQKGGGSAELKTMELAAATSERVSITLEGARCLDKNMMFVFVDKIAQDPSTYSMNDDGTVVNFNPAIPANAAVTLRWFDTDVGTFDTAIFASDAEFAAGELTNKAPNVKQVHSFGDQIQTSNANYVKSELQSNLLNYTTNRILEIPQDIKLELNNGTLTLKAGSKVYVPNGFEADGTTPKFDIVTTESDVTETRSFNANYQLQHFYDVSNSSLGNPFQIGFNLFSGNTAPSSFQTQIDLWYDTSANLMKYTADNGSTWSVVNYSLPLCVFSSPTNITSIDQIFNGLGYIGSTVFALPEVKVQAPNGKDSNRRYLNRELNITQVTCATIASDVTRGCLWFFIYNDNGIGYADSFGYDSEHNYSLSGTTPFSGNALCTASATNGVLSNFKPYQVDSIANSNASNFSQAGRSYLSGLGMPSGRYIDLTLGASGSTYTAPANGWFCFNKISTGVQFASFVGSVKAYSVVEASGREVSIYVPARKGESVILNYNLAGTTSFFRFVYAEGENNV